MIVFETPAELAVQQFLTTLGNGDFDAVRPLCHPEITWDVRVRGVPGAGVHRGCDAIFAVIGPVRALFAAGSPTLNILSLTSKHGLVTVESQAGGRLADGRPYDNRYVMVFEVKDGLVYALREYMDSYYVHQLMG
jgi:ketosteroid isomerase-like protein